MSLSATVRALVLAGATPEMILAVVEAHEAEAVDPLEERRANEAARTARYRERGGGQIPPDLRAAVFERDGYRCLECDSIQHLQCDHIHPVSKGGETTFENLQTLCRVCNARKKDRIRKAIVRGMSAETQGQARKSKDAPSRTRVVVSSSSSLRSEEGKESPPNPNGLGAPKGAETARGSRIPENWLPVPDYEPEAYGLSQAQHDAELTKFLDYWRSVPGAKGRKSDWPATWRNWMRRASENSARKAPHERPDPNAKLDARHANYARAWEGSERAAGRDWKP